MSKYAICACSTVDIDKKYLDENNIGIVNFQFILDGKSNKDDFGSNISFKEFYDMMRKGATPTSSQPSPDAYLETWEKYLSDGLDIMHITLSSGISGAYNSALIAKDLANEKYPDRKIIVLDSLSASGGYGLLLRYAVDKKNEGMGIEELETYIIDIRQKLHHIFFMSDLTSLIRGGRISAFAGAVGGILNIFPVLMCNKEGKLEIIDKVRGEGKAIKAVIKYITENVSNGFDFSSDFLLSHSDCMNIAQNLIDEIKKVFPKSKMVEVSSIGTTIGSHTGPGTVALFFLGNNRKWWSAKQGNLA